MVVIIPISKQTENFQQGKSIWILASSKIYRVFIKEGQKVNAYYTVKIYIFEASMGFILTTTYEHLFIYTKDLKYFT